MRIHFKSLIKGNDLYDRKVESFQVISGFVRFFHFYSYIVTRLHKINTAEDKIIQEKKLRI